MKTPPSRIVAATIRSEVIGDFHEPYGATVGFAIYHCPSGKPLDPGMAPHVDLISNWSFGLQGSLLRSSIDSRKALPKWPLTGYANRIAPALAYLSYLS